jgi:hypothetical protein
MMVLAFKKYIWEKGGLWQVTEVEENETHPLRLYQGVIRKYDYRLHQKYDSFDEMMEKEMNFCKDFFVDYKFSKKQLQAIITFKDAYALRDVTARLLYKKGYSIKGFCCHGMMKEE